MNAPFDTSGRRDANLPGFPPTQEPLQSVTEIVAAEREPDPLEETEWTSEDEPQEVEERRAERQKSVLREVVETLLLALLIYFAVRSVVQNFKVEGSSMEPSLHHGEYLLVNKAAYMNVSLGALQGAFPWVSAQEAASGSERLYPLGTPRRGDIVVFRYPKDPTRDFIKRVVALPGETVEVRAGIVYVNNQRLEEPYVLENPSYSRPPEVVPPEHYFVLGDNRNNSSDSHVWGPVPSENIVGKAWLTYWPLKNWGSIGDHAALAEEP